MVERRVTALLGPRRYGKTSLLRRVTADLAEAGPETIWIDLYELNSMADLAGAIDQGVRQLQGRAGRLPDSLSRIGREAGRGGVRQDTSHSGGAGCVKKKKQQDE